MAVSSSTRSITGGNCSPRPSFDAGTLPMRSETFRSDRGRIASRSRRQPLVKSSAVVAAETSSNRKPISVPAARRRKNPRESGTNAARALRSPLAKRVITIGALGLQHVNWCTTWCSVCRWGEQASAGSCFKALTGCPLRSSRTLEIQNWATSKTARATLSDGRCSPRLLVVMRWAPCSVARAAHATDGFGLPANAW